MKKILLFLLLVVGVAAVWIVSIWPPTRILPEKITLWRLNGGLPAPILSDDPWVKRGEYLVRTASCALCHTPFSFAGADSSHPLQGGMRCRWDVYGEAVSLNLTPDAETGIGNWSERDWIVAMKSGIYPDGRVAHWQAMPWDMHSNFLLDDLRAMYRYLKTLPPAKQPPSHPIREPLPEPDTFYFGR